MKFQVELTGSAICCYLLYYPISLNICFQRHLITSANSQCSASYLVQLVLRFHSSCILQLVLFSKSNVSKERQDFSSIKINNGGGVICQAEHLFLAQNICNCQNPNSITEINGIELTVIFHFPKASASLQIYGVSLHLYRSERIWLCFFNDYCSNAYQTYVGLDLSSSKLYSDTIYKYCNPTRQGEDVRVMRGL